jgi:hypothetical protein
VPASIRQWDAVDDEAGIRTRKREEKSTVRRASSVS